MSSDVNPRRSYHSDRRQRQAQQTRLAVVDAGRRLFLELGYAATTVAAIAAEAAVSVETVYKAFGNKPGVAKAVFDIGMVGDAEPVPLMRRQFVLRNMAEPDPRRKLTAYGEHLAEIAPRVNPIQLVIRDAAVTDPGAAELWEQLLTERLTGMTAFAEHLHAGGHLRRGVSTTEARDVLWTHNSVELWDLLVNRRGWATKRYGRWVGRQLIAALL
jgi:AcrR family transcriptional regulator